MTRKKYSELKKQFQINTDNEIENGLAMLTHYLQNRENTKLSYFKTEAQKYLKNYFKVSENISTYTANQLLLPVKWDVPFPPPEKPKFTFIDLFAGIGGFRIALQELGGKCVFSSEIDSNAKKTYEANYGEVPFGDIRQFTDVGISDKVLSERIPDHTVLTGGFPCQAFSIAGKRGGFSDTRGTLFFDIARIIKAKNPQCVFLENVKNLQTHDNRNTYSTIKNTLEKLGYHVREQVLNSMEYGDVPQNRERMYIVGFKDFNAYKSFEFPDAVKLEHSVRDLLEHNVENKYYYNDKPLFARIVSGITSMETVYQWRRKYVRANKKGVCPTLTANMGTGGHNVPIIKDKHGIRKLTPLECVRMQGFPPSFIFPKSSPDSALYKQAGNSVSVPVVSRIACNILKAMEKSNVS